MTFKSVAEFMDEGNGFSPTAAELRLIKAAQSGLPCILYDIDTPSRPDAATDDNSIRATLLRLLILGGTKECGIHQRGVQLAGGWIDGAIDLAFCAARGQTALIHCQFNETPIFNQTAFGQLSLSNSAFPGLFAESVQIVGNLFLRNVSSTGTVNVCGSKIGGQLDCTRAVFKSALDENYKRAPAFFAQNIVVCEGLVLLNVSTKGMVDVTGAKIGGELTCEGANFFNEGDVAFLCQRMQVTQGFIFRNLDKIGISDRQIDLTAAHVGDLVDDIVSWPSTGNSIVLDGFSYDRIAGDAPATFAARRQWLETGSLWLGDFRPQPYTQFALVLRQMGHAAEARKVLMERERLLAQYRFAADQKEFQAALSGGRDTKADVGWIWLRMKSAQLWSGLMRRVAGYGYAPQYALYWSLLCVGVSFLAYFMLWRCGAMVPSDAVVLTSAEWKAAFDANPLAPALVWADANRSGPAASHYETFYALAYAFDVFAPIVDFGQQSTWSATTVTWAGWFARVYTWALQAAGYIVTTLGIAAATGIIQRNQPD